MDISTRKEKNITIVQEEKYKNLFWFIPISAFTAFFTGSAVIPRPRRSKATQRHTTRHKL